MVVLVILASAQAAYAKADRERLKQAISAVLADTLSDTTEVIDRLGFVHRVYADTSGLWYQSDEVGPDDSPAIRIAEHGARCPTSFVTDDPAYGSVLVVVWLEEADQTPAVCCRRRVLAQPFWVWSMPRDVTPHPGEDLAV